VPQAIEVRDERAAAAEHFELPSSAELLQRACGPEAVRRAEAMVYGTVRGSHGESVGGALVTVAWQKFSTGGAGVLLGRDEFRDVTADEFGRWRLCGVPRDQLLTARAAVGSRKSDAVQVRTSAARALQPISVALPAGPSP
jgi:hypothetical protein